MDLLQQRCGLAANTSSIQSHWLWAQAQEEAAGCKVGELFAAFSHLAAALQYWEAPPQGSDKSQQPQQNGNGQQQHIGHDKFPVWDQTQNHRMG